MTDEQVDKRCAKLMGIEYSWIPKWQKRLTSQLRLTFI
jgi:hypothetical protein